ncbi:MAG: galactitol-1-phosphate 5-dehydrogenase [Deltaproteobacteria bacterium]|nr:galactitol-1-phosphate 5-dehydrogenase [Deltaproteobacteria bacterium]MBW2306958.1 galactitol-1-phosphate 5-dehydrogenase [Deltaproteobacteria bacterium]
MKALKLTGPNQFEYTDEPMPEVKPDEALIRVKAVGICGSDFHGASGKSGRRIPPIIMGHEAAGVIESAGRAVLGFKPGDRVTFDSTIYCNKCRFCQQGRINLCDNRRILGVSTNEYRQNGAMAEYVSVPEHILYPIPDSMLFEHAAMIEPLSVAVHAANLTPVLINESCAIIGTGVIGLLVVQAMKIKGCGKIFAIDIDEERLALAKKFGADETCNPRNEDVVQKILELTDGVGADTALEAVGIEKTMNTAIDIVKKGGRVTLVGNLSPEIKVYPQRIVTRELIITGSMASRGEYPACIDLIASGRIHVEPLINKVAPLSEGAKWFAVLAEGRQKLLKVILQP